MPETNSMNNDFLQRLVNAIDKHLSDDSFGVAELAAELGISRSTLHRKVRMVAKKSVSIFIRETRLKRSFELLKNRDGTVSEIAYQVGFGSTTYFTKCFHDFYGIPPGDVLKGNYPQQFIERQKNFTVTSKKNTIYSLFVGFIIIVAILFSYFIFRMDSPSIAVMPVTVINTANDSVATLTVLREYLHNKLGKIDGLTVISGLATDKYVNIQKSPEEIWKEVNATYILSIRKNNSNGRNEIFVIIDSKKGKQISTYTYPLGPNGSDYSEIATQITLNTAKDLKIHLSKEEEKLIQEKLSENEAALRFYESAIGLSEHAKFKKHSPEWNTVVKELKAAVKNDSTFAEAWLKLAEIYSYQKLLPNRYMSEFLNLRSYRIKLDSIQMFLNRARTNGRSDKVLEMFVNSMNSNAKFEDTELARNPIEISNYYRAAAYLAYAKEDYYNSIKSWFKFKDNLHMDLEEINDLHYFIAVTGTSGFYSVSEKLARLALKNTGDTKYYKYSMIAAVTGRGAEVFRDSLMCYYQADTMDIVFPCFLMNINLFLHNFEESYQFLQKRESLLKLHNQISDPNILMAYLYKKFGNEQKGMWHCQKVLENRIALTDTVIVTMPSRIYLQLAAGYSMVGQKDSALLCLEKITKLETYPIETIMMINSLPHLIPLGNDKKFLKYKSLINSKFSGEQEKIKKLLEKNGYSEP